jgi:hypothetical protein
MLKFEETIGTPSQEYVSGRTRAFGFPVIRKSGQVDNAMMYVVVSYDAGHTWSVLALACTDEAWLRGILPAYEGKPDLLGMANPKFAAAARSDHFDDGAFLKGPTYFSSQ